MDEKEYNLLLVRRYIAGEATPDELEVFFYLVDQGKLDEELLQAANEMEGLIIPLFTVKPKVFRMPVWLRVAAAILLLTAGIFYLVSSNRSKQQVSQMKEERYKNDVAPGGDRATLTLGDGSIITLDSAKNGRLANQGNATILKVDNGKLAYNTIKGEDNKVVAYNTVATPRGGQYMIVLPDETKVWLNAASSIRFPTAFTGTERNVEITGEVYFEVTKNASKPFTVQIPGNTEIEVLGTHFNINAYDDEPVINTTLLEGSIKIKVENQQPVLLSPGQQSQIDKNKNIKIDINPSIDDVMAWKNGMFMLNKDIVSIMKQVQRWYDVDVVYKAPAVSQIFMGNISRNEPISKLLKILELTEAIHFSIEGKTITVMP
ncbi:MAG: FecR domain-containing protein [Bacteroidota bacterium]